MIIFVLGVGQQIGFVIININENFECHNILTNGTASLIIPW